MLKILPKKKQRVNPSINVYLGKPDGSELLIQIVFRATLE